MISHDNRADTLFSADFVANRNGIRGIASTIGRANRAADHSGW